MLLWALLCISGVTAYVTDCRGDRPASVAPNLLERCNVTASCDYCDRNHLSFDFVCCEDNSGWVSAHSVMPMIFYVYFQNAEWTMLLALGFESFEQLSFNLTSISVNKKDAETLFGSVVGDGLIQGGVGLWLGVLVTYCFDFPLLVSTSVRANLIKKKGKRRLYIALWMIHATTILFLHFTDKTSRILYGLYANMAVQLLIFWILFPWLKSLYGTETAEALVWRQHPNDSASKTYPKSRRIGFFYLVGLIIVLIQLANSGIHVLQNDWYQVWLVEAIIITALTIAAIVVANQRKDHFSVVGFASGYCLGIATGFTICGLAFENTTFLYVALAFLIVSAAGFVLSQIFLSRPEPYNVNYSRRFENTKTQSLSDRYRTLKDL